MTCFIIIFFISTYIFLTYFVNTQMTIYIQDTFYSFHSKEKQTKELLKYNIISCSQGTVKFFCRNGFFFVQLHLTSSVVYEAGLSQTKYFHF